MVKSISLQQVVLEKIVALAKEVFKRKLDSNPNEISFDAEHFERKLGIETHNFHGTISKYERDQYYTLRIRIIGYSIVITEYYDDKVTFFIDDGDYGRIDDYDEETINNCFATIYDDLTELLN